MRFLIPLQTFLKTSPEKYLQQCHYQSSWGSQQQQLEDHVLQLPLEEKTQLRFNPTNELLRNNFEIMRSYSPDKLRLLLSEYRRRQ